jgi:ABC-type glycerol-3-phosphate transport system substrate-binding protein
MIFLSCIDGKLHLICNHVSSDTSTKEITILMPENSSATFKFRNSTFEKSARLFEEANPGVKVTVEKLPMPKGYRTAIMERLKGSKPGDLIFGQFDSVLNEQKAFAADLIPLFKADPVSRQRMDLGAIPESVHQAASGQSSCGKRNIRQRRSTRDAIVRVARGKQRT